MRRYGPVYRFDLFTGTYEYTGIDEDPEGDFYAVSEVDAEITDMKAEILAMCEVVEAARRHWYGSADNPEDLGKALLTFARREA